MRVIQIIIAAMIDFGGAILVAVAVLIYHTARACVLYPPCPILRGLYPAQTRAAMLTVAIAAQFGSDSKVANRMTG